MFLELIEKQNRRTFNFNNIKSFQLDTIYKDQYGDGHETFRAIRHSIIGISVDFALVFDDRVESWSEFFNSRFKELLIPHFLKISVRFPQAILKWKVVVTCFPHDDVESVQYL